MGDFRFRLPAIVELTIAQQLAYNEQRPLLVTGGPGSGKTVVSIFRYLRQISQDQNAMFFTFNRTLMSSIRGPLRQRADILLATQDPSKVEEIINTNVGSMFEWYGDKFRVKLSEETAEEIIKNFNNYIVKQRGNKKFSELFIDESQDLHPDIIDGAYELTEKVSCGADRSQDLQGHYIEPADEYIFDLLNKRKITLRQELTQNFRNTREIFDFARKFVPEDEAVQSIDLSELPNGEDPDVRGSLIESSQLSLIKQIIEQNTNSNIGIIVHFKKHIMLIKEYLENHGYSCSNNAPEHLSFSYYCNQMPYEDKRVVESRLKTPFILTYDSCKGLEFDIVILPFFEMADFALNNYKPNNENPEYDAWGNPKYWATPNHYYVAATRARKQLYILHNKKPNILNFYTRRKENNLFSDNNLSDLPF